MTKYLDKESTDFVRDNLLFNYGLWDDNALLIQSFYRNNNISIRFNSEEYWMIISGMDKKYILLEEPDVFRNGVDQTLTLYHAINKWMEENDLCGNAFLTKLDNAKRPALFFSKGQNATLSIEEYARQFDALTRKELNRIPSAVPYIATAYSGPYSGLEQMNSAYENTVMLDQLHFFTGYKTIITTTLTEHCVVPGISQIYTECRELRQALITHNETRVHQLIHRLFEETIAQGMNMNRLLLANDSMIDTITVFNCVYHLEVDTSISPHDYACIQDYVLALTERIDQLLDHMYAPYYSWSVMLAMNILQNQYESPIALSGIAESIGVNVASLSSDFNRETGMSVPSYLNRLRVEKATKLLATTNLSIQEISDRLSYGNVRYFSECFRKIEGVTPGEYRKRHAE